MEKDVYIQQGLDLKRLVLVLGKKIWLILASILVGAFIGGVTYKIVTNITNGTPEYRASSDYYITFNFEEFGNADDYYNAYTWDGILRDDPIVDYAVSLLPEEITKNMVQTAVTGEMLGDYRVLTVHVTTEHEEITSAIANAYHQSMVHFGEEIELLKKIDVWSKGETVLLEKNTKTSNAAFLGAMIGGLLVVFVLFGVYILEDAVYVEKDAKERFGLPVFGMTTKKQDAKQEQILQDNLTYAFGEAPPEIWNGEQIPTKQDYETLRSASHVLIGIPWGRNNGKQIERVLDLLKLQNCEAKGIVIQEAEDSFVKAYYKISKHI